MYVKIFPILKNKNLKEIYNDLAKNWVWSESSWGHDGIKKFINLVQKGKVLDLGCGSGFQSKFISQFGLEVIGIDFSEWMIKESRKRVPEAKFLVMDILKIKFPKAYFDGIYARASLLHIKKKNIGETLKKLNDILKKGGIIYIALKEGEGESYMNHPQKGSRFFAFYREKEMDNLLKKHGFKTLEVFYEKASNTNWLQILARKD